MWKESAFPDPETAEEATEIVLRGGEQEIDMRLEEFYAFQRALIEQINQWDEADKQERGEQREILNMAAVGKAMPEATHTGAMAAQIAPWLTSLAQSAESPAVLFAAITLWNDLHQNTQKELEEEPEAITKLRDEVEAESLTPSLRKEKEELIDYLAVWYRGKE